MSNGIDFGSDTGRLRARANEVDATRKSLVALKDQYGDRVTHLKWQGDDRNQFAGRRLTQLRRTVEEMERALRVHADKLRANADQQDQASR